MKIIILGGFVGSGKTSLLLQLAPFLASCSQKDPGVVVLENEISVTDVDTKLLRSRNLTVRNLAAGCICCTSGAALPDSIAQIQREHDPDYLLIEATGMAYPDAIVEIVEGEMGLTSKVAVLADASRWEKLSAAMPGFVQGQLNKASVVYLNKSDLVAKERLDKLCSQIAGMTDAEVYPVCLTAPIDSDFLKYLQ